MSPSSPGAPPRFIRISRKSTYLVLVIFLIAVTGLTAWSSGLIQLGAADEVRVQVIGHNWWWEFIYPDYGFKTANELHIPEGALVQLEVSSVDVLHTLSIPELGVGVDGFPGRVSTTQFRAPGVGERGGECSEICGTAHNMMRLKVVVQEPEEFAAWARAQGEPAAEAQTDQQRAGYEFVSTACARCHSLDPAEPRTDLLGPNLAHLMSRSVFAGASFNLNESNLKRWLRDTQAMKAGNDMIVNLPRDDFEAVTEYLLLLR